jgi:3'(2'), 5'-bisphosphate nucleotidase
MADDRLAVHVAELAAAELVGLRTTSQARGDAPEWLRAEGDRRAHATIVEQLRRWRPGDHVLSEEGTEDDARTGAARVWIIDPLDGTREYAEPGRSDWAVHIALWERDAIRTAAVGLPALGVTYSAAASRWLPPPLKRPPRLLVSRTRPPSMIGRLVEALGAELVEMGSAGAKIMAVVRGEGDIYVHAGGQYEWDSAAPTAIAAAAGLHVSRLGGAPLRYNQADPWLPDVLVCRPELAGDVLRAAALLQGGEASRPDRGAGP